MPEERKEMYCQICKKTVWHPPKYELWVVRGNIVRTLVGYTCYNCHTFQPLSKDNTGPFDHFRMV